jgi:hypothetical protein
MSPKLPGRGYGKDNLLIILYTMQKFVKLSKSEMKNVLGGKAAHYSCACIGSVGAWTANYSSVTQMANSIKESCSSGQGSCSAA